MNTRKKLSAGVILWFFAFLLQPSGSVWAQSFSRLKLDPHRVLWSDLSFGAQGTIVDLAIDIRLAPFPAAEFQAIWRTYPQSIQLPSVGREVYNLEVSRVIDYIFSRPVRLWNQVLFDPKQVSSLYRVRLRRGRDDIERAYWFSEEGVHRLRRMPKTKGETSLEPAKWTDVKTSFYPYAPARRECPQVIDPMLMIYLVSAAPIDKRGEVLTLCVFGKQQLHEVRLTYQRLENLEVDYFANSGEGRVHKKGKVDALRVTVESEPMVSGEKDAENFSFLGMQENIAIHIDPRLRIPLQVSGKIPTVGLVTLKVSEVKMKKWALSNQRMSD
ncbi:MAG: hypothetical protein P8075_13675 [Deltaproteobacteria bacterium]|jgi:hypothetical protein